MACESCRAYMGVATSTCSTSRRTMVYGEECRCARPTDLSHCNLICVICHRPSIRHLARSPSLRLDTRLIPSKLLHAHITKSPPGRLFSRRQNRRSGQPRCALHSTDRCRVGTLPPALDHLVLLLSCALFFCFLSSVSFTSQYHTPPPVTAIIDSNTLSTILQHAHVGRRTLLPSFSTVPIQSAYLPACHPENHTIQNSSTRLDLRDLACI